jgi:hypothetical protein
VLGIVFALIALRIGLTSRYVCITIIDTILLTNYTNNAYIFDTYDTHTPLSDELVFGGVALGSVVAGVANAVVIQVCIMYIGVVSVYMQYNCVYYCDTYGVAGVANAVVIQVCYIIIGVVCVCVYMQYMVYMVYMVYNCVYYCDTYGHMGSVVAVANAVVIQVLSRTPPIHT